MPGTETGDEGWYQYGTNVYHYTVTDDGEFEQVPSTPDLPNVLSERQWRRLVQIGGSASQMTGTGDAR